MRFLSILRKINVEGGCTLAKLDLVTSGGHRKLEEGLGTNVVSLGKLMELLAWNGYAFLWSEN